MQSVGHFKTSLKFTITFFIPINIYEDDAFKEYEGLRSGQHNTKLLSYMQYHFSYTGIILFWTRRVQHITQHLIGNTETKENYCTHITKYMMVRGSDFTKN